LAGLLSWRNLPWCIKGDFNVTRFPAMIEFFDFILDQGLTDLPLASKTFTWSNERDSPSCPELIYSWSLRNGKPNFVTYHREGSVDFVRVISRSSSIAVIFIGVVGPSNLKICG
jgi:hypothetical protein